MEQDPASSLVWVRDKKDIWRVAKIVSAADDEIVVEGKDGNETFKGADHAIFDATHNLPLPDLSQYNNLHEAPLLYGLKKRFADDTIYTHCGEILVSVNPYKDIPNLYNLDDFVNADDGEESDDDGEEHDPPHVYVIAKKALRDLTASTKNQSVVISGESGAGKTEASKHVMRYLINESSKVQSDTMELGSNIQKRLMQSNVILEAFGNAKTVRNDNSSRFGKYIKLRYSPSTTIIGAKTDHFLLEKSRLITVAKGERNYHIFYQLLAGSSDLGSPSDYAMLNGGKTLTVSGVDDKEEFEHTCEAMDIVGINSATQSSVWEILTGLLKLGNVKFALKEPENPEKGSSPTDSGAMAAISALLGVENNEFILRLTEKRTVSGRGSITTVPLDDRQSSDNSHALIKYVYGCMFEWLVGKINLSHATADASSGKSNFIGILDIFGFEIFKSNSFEQLCINFANEILQQQFNHQVFVLEKQAYEAEGIDSSVIQFQDNQPVIDLISKKPKGLMPVLEEHCLMSRDPDNQALLSTYNRNQLSHENYDKPRFGNESFVVKHFAGNVEYQVVNFIEKNNDSMTDELLDIVKFSSKDVLKEIMNVGSSDGDSDDDDDDDDNGMDDPDLPPAAPRRSTIATGRRTTKQGKQGFAALNTVSYTFRLQLDSLASTLRATSPHYIKCIKPNAAKAPGGFSNALVIEQLRYSGVLEVVRIRREGFPTRVPYDEFHKKYAILLKDTTYDAKDDRAASLLICEKALKEGMYQGGKSCLFLRDMMLRELSLAVKMFYGAKVTKIVARFRGLVAKRKYKKARDSASQLEAFARMLRKKKEFKKEKELMIKIQSHVRGRLERVGYGKKLRVETAAATKIASARRMMLEHQDYLKTLDSVTKIEAKFRQHKAEADFKDEKKKAIAVQAAIRAHQAQKEKATKLYSIARLQVCVKAFIRNCRLSSKVLDLHMGARNKEVEVVKKMLSDDPSLGVIRNRYDHMKTILHTACKAGHFEIVELLDPSYEDVFAVDSLGNCALHYAAGSARLQIVKHLAGIVNTAAMLDVKDHKVGLKKALRRLKSQKSDLSEDGVATKEAEVLVEGWLKKHKVGKSTDTRWCTLSRTDLKYFKRKSDKTPQQTISLEVAMVKYCMTEKHTFEIHSPLLLDAKRNPHGRMYFVCDTEVALQKWLAALRISDAMTEMLITTASSNPAAKKDIVNLEARKAFVCQKNGQGQTALHVLAKSDKTKWRQSDSEGKMPAGAGARRRLSTAHVLKRQQTTFGGASSMVRVADVATFLLESGCNVNAADVDGNTAIRLAVENKLEDLTLALVKKGADVKIKGGDGRSAMDCMSSATIDSITDVGTVTVDDLPALKGPPAKVAGGTYMSFRFGKLSIMDLPEDCDPYIKITIFTKTEMGGTEVAEEPQVISNPVFVCSEFIYIGYTFNLQSALEDVHGGLAVIEVCDKKKKGDVVSWCSIDLAIGSDDVNSKEVHYDMHEGPVNLKRDADYVSADMVLSGDIILTKLE